MGNLCAKQCGPELMQMYVKATHSRFSQEEIARMYRIFHQCAPAGKMDVEQFKKYLDQLGAESATLGAKEKVDTQANAAQLFRGFDRDKDGNVSFIDFLEFQEAIIYDTELLPEIIFNMYDEDLDGRVTKEEVLSVVTNSTILLAQNAEEDADLLELRSLVEAEIEKLWSFLDVNGDGSITIEELTEASKLCPGLLQGLKNLS
eukprot:TRINITY_DN5755_c0_g1_i1.p1 TRINITY_DN5755_c0_g1~~TRINITY_DN5755_c0_g1_i1.p1  ORF type:complete len:203 (+),score=60.86 TRINITY_DN5755_c0_g1_i1:84-692(+)